MINYKSLVFRNVLFSYGFIFDARQNKVQKQNKTPEQSERHEVTDVLEIHPCNVIYNFTVIRTGPLERPRNSILVLDIGQGMLLQSAFKLS